MVTVGIDEVGRGCLAGPLVAGAVILPDGYVHDATVGWRLADSKVLSARQRELAAQALPSVALAHGLGWVSAHEVDRHGITNSVRLAMRRALRQITVPYDEVIIDGNIKYLPHAQAIIHADATVPAVSAASILAKVARDTYMQQLATEPRYTAYGFERHVGYGTAYHLTALAAYGPSRQHRMSFAPLKNTVEGAE